MKSEQDKIRDRDHAIMEARAIISQPYFIVDTETTSLKGEMCQIAIRFSGGRNIKTLVKPTVPIEPGASGVHHITDSMVQDAPTAIEALSEIPKDGVMVIYNAPFDLEIMKRSARACGGEFHVDPSITIFDVMRIYSEYDGEWNDYYGNYRWHKLEAACNRCGIIADETFHDALSDCIMTDRLIHHIAKQELSSEQVELLDGEDWITE